MLKDKLDNLRKNGALIHNITNYVTVNDVANALLACGGSPIMADDEEEAPEITAICGGLNINIGTLNKRTIPAMYAAGRKANELGHRVLLDPVGSGASRLRTETARGLIREIRFDVIRGNISEIKALAVGTETTKGVDADVADAVTEDNLSEAVEFVKSFARREGCVAAVTGAIDLVSDGQRCFVIRNGRPEMGRITGTGCQLSAVMTALLRPTGARKSSNRPPLRSAPWDWREKSGFSACLREREMRLTGIGSSTLSITWMGISWRKEPDMKFDKRDLLLYAVDGPALDRRRDAVHSGGESPYGRSDFCAAAGEEPVRDRGSRGSPRNSGALQKIRRAFRH